MTQGYYLLASGFFITVLFFMVVDMKQLIVLLDSPHFLFSKLYELFLAIPEKCVNDQIFYKCIPDKSIISSLITSVFSVMSLLLGNTIINSVKYNNQVKELKKILYSLIDNQVLSIQLMQYRLIKIKTFLRLIYPILSQQQQAETETKKNMVRNFWSTIACAKRIIVKVEKDNLYEKLLIDRKSLKAEPSIRVDDYFNTLRVLLINLETLVESNFPASGKQENFLWRKVDLIYDILDEHITDLGVLICKAKMCNIVLVGDKENKESLVKIFYELISPNTSKFESPKRELIPLDDLEKIDRFINERCGKQKLKYCDFSELIQSARADIQSWNDLANDPLRGLIQSTQHDQPIT
jgi:hypothetical protein